MALYICVSSSMWVYRYGRWRLSKLWYAVLSTPSKEREGGWSLRLSFRVRSLRSTFRLANTKVLGYEPAASKAKPVMTRYAKELTSRPCFALSTGPVRVSLSHLLVSSFLEHMGLHGSGSRTNVQIGRKDRCFGHVSVCNVNTTVCPIVA